MGKYLVVFLVAVTSLNASALSTILANYDGFDAFAAIRYGNFERRNFLQSEKNYDGLFGDEYRLSLGVDTAIPYLRQFPLSLTFALDWIIAQQNLDFASARVEGTNTVLAYPVSENGVDVALGITGRFFQTAPVGFFFAAEGKYANASHSFDSERNKTVRVHGLGYRFSAGMAIRVWDPIYFRAAVGMDVAYYNNGVNLKYDDAGNAANLERYPRTDFTSQAYRTFFVSVGVAVRFRFDEQGRMVWR